MPISELSSRLSMLGLAGMPANRPGVPYSMGLSLTGVSSNDMMCTIEPTANVSPGSSATPITVAVSALPAPWSVSTPVAKRRFSLG